MIGIIAAVSPEGVIGVGNTIPWHHPADLKRFKRLTVGATVIMGRLTWESLPRKPLAGRRNIVIASHPVAGVETFRSIEAALRAVSGDVWFIGGARIFAEAMQHADLIDLTYVPDQISAADAVYFPPIDAEQWDAGPIEPHEADSGLSRRVFRKRRAPAAPAGRAR